MTLTDKELHAEMIRMRKYERDVMIELLEHLQEVYDRRLFADFGHSSLVKYLVKELGYSESAAFRRYQALRLIKEIPEVKTRLEKGEINLTSASMIQGGLNNTADKIEVIEKSIYKTTNDTHDLILEKNPDLKKRDIINPINNGESRAHLTLSSVTIEKLEMLKAISKNYNNDEVINMALDLAINRLDKGKQRINKVNRSAETTVPSSTAKKLWRRAKSRCEYPGCDEFYNLEIEHITPRAKGGGDELQNLKLYCKTHNQRSAIKEFGLDTMREYLN